MPRKMRVMCIGSNVCSCMMNFVVPSAMQNIGQNQLPREMISRAKDCNGNLTVHYFEDLVDALPDTARRTER